MVEKPERAGGGRLPRRYAATADFGRRPRLAAGRPGIVPAQSSQRSACFAPRRASAYVTRIVAPFPSPTSLLQLSQTSTVLRATVTLLEFDERKASVVEIRSRRKLVN
jgi:hypothetical protein